MEHSHVSDAFGSPPGTELALRGWIFRIRKTGGLVFVLLRDSTGIIQVVVNRERVPDGEFDAAERALVESSLEVRGRVVEEPKAPGGREVRATGVKIVSYAERFPIFSGQSEEFLMDNRHLWIRSRKISDVMRVKARVLAACRRWLDENGFIEVTPPILTPSACEGGSTLFSLRYFDRTAYLSQSAQLYLEAAMFPLERVYALTPSFRAERSRTRRHLTEYMHLEAEEAWADNEQNMRTQESLITFVCQEVASSAGELLRSLGRDPESLLSIEVPFKRVSYRDAVRSLDGKMEHGFEYGSDLGAREERALTQDETAPIFIYEYPVSAKGAFYMKLCSGDPGRVLCSDMLAPEGYGEIIGASVRETDPEVLVRRLEALGEDIENYKWYLDLRRYGSVPHAGWGLGMERLVRWICRLDHIRDATLFPRTPNRVYP